MASVDSHAKDDASFQTVGPVQPEIADLLGIARRGWLFIVAGTAFGLICALMILSAIPPIYKASSRIAFERTLPRYMQSNKVSNEPIIDDYDTLGQSYVIGSESILLHVVRSMSLASDPDFAGEKDSETLGSHLLGLFRNAAQALGLPKKSAGAADQPADPRKDPEKIAFDTLTRNLTVGREDVASVIMIAFSWKDPVKAATIVNSIVDTYINDSLAEKRNSTSFARKFVQEHLEELKQQVKDADRALLEYKAANNLVGSDQLTLTHGQVGILQTQLTNARLAMVEAKSRMERIPGAADAARVPAAGGSFIAGQIADAPETSGGRQIASAPRAPDNELITKMRSELADLSVRANDIEKLVGKDHLAAVKVRDRMKDVRQAIANEQERIAGSSGNDYELARARYNDLSAEVSQVVSSEGVNSNKQARLRELEGSVESLRGLYNRTLQEAGEMNRVEGQPSITPDARILNRAAPPLQTESSKKQWLILASGSIMGLLLGVAALLARNFPFGVFRTSQQVTYATGLSCSVLPEILGGDELASLRTGEYLLDWPYSRYAQTLHSIWATINVAQRKSDAKVVCVVSSNPGEGKTTIAINLAAHFALRSATRVLVIDADFHRQSLTKRVAPDARVGLREALAEPFALAKFVVRKERLNLDVLPCPVADRMPNAAELIGTVEMEQLVKVAREAYDLVIFEVPPMAAVVDSKMIAAHCDGFVFVVEWGKTSQRLVLECLSDASELLDRILCVVLNKVDPAALRSIEHYKGEGFLGYYSDQKEA
jgi:polysaccharide biosynthesis transport protein